MTLIIGAKCPEGIVLISDTKITLGSGKFKYGQKIELPLERFLPGTPVLSAAAGNGNLFDEFNRKLPSLVRQRIREIQLNNYAKLSSVGINLDYPEKIKEYATTSAEGKKLKKEIINPDQNIYVYDGEDLLDDCRELISNICKSQIERFGVMPLEVLIATKTFEPTLHYIDAIGREQQIRDFCAIGAGSEYAKHFFERLWTPEKNINETIALAFFVIKYVENLKIDDSVGVNYKQPPQIAVILTDGQYGFLNPEIFDNMKQLIEEIDKSTDAFEKLMSNLNLPLLLLKK